MTGPTHDRIDRALADPAAVQVDAAHPGLRRERHELRMRLEQLPLADTVQLLRQHDDRSPLGRLVGERRELRDLGELLLLDAGSGEGRRPPGGSPAPLAVPVLVQQQGRASPAASTARPLMASTLCCTNWSIPGLIDRRQQPPDRGGDQADEQRDQHGVRHTVARVDRERLEGDAHDQEDDGELREHVIHRAISFGRLLTLGSFDEREMDVNPGTTLPVLAAIRTF